MLRAAAVLWAAVLPEAVLDTAAGADSACKETGALVDYVRERVAGLEEDQISAVVAALQGSPPGCLTSDVLEERERCGEQGVRDVVRAVEMFTLGLDAVPAPIRPSAAAPCVQIPSLPSIVVLEWSHQADSLRRVRSFDVWRQRMGGDDSQAELRKLTTPEFEKCRNKGRCTFHDTIEPGQNYIYSVTATNAFGTSSTMEILCATRADESLNARCFPENDALATNSEPSEPADVGVDATSMTVFGTVFWCVVSAGSASGLTIFLLYCAVVNGNSQLCDTISRRMNSNCDENQGSGPGPMANVAESGRFDLLLQEVYRWNSVIFLALVYGLGIWMWLPVELQLLPTLKNMTRTSEQYIPIAREERHPGEGHISHGTFAALQGSGDLVKLVADSYENFIVSALQWEHDLIALQREQRIIIDRMVDGTTEIWQPMTMALFLACATALTYGLELLVWTKWLWEGSWLKEVLQYTSWTSPGCKLGRYLLPLCCFGWWRAYAVIVAAIGLATTMRRNVDQLSKLADFLPPSEDMVRIRTGLHEIVSRHNEGRRQRRWGITLGHCAGAPCHIDMKFWKVGVSTLSYIVVPLCVAVALLVFYGRDRQHRKAKEEQDQLINHHKEIQEEIKKLAEEKERLYTRAKDEALTQQQRAEALENAHRAEKEERDAIKAEQRLVMREIRLKDLYVLWEDSRDAPPHLRKNDWRRCEVNKGAAGQICRAWCEGNLRKKVAIKRVHPTNTAMLQRSFSMPRTTFGRLHLTDEQKFFLYLQHENIAKCYGTLQEKKGRHSIVMELCKCDLRKWLSDDTFWSGKTLLHIDDQKMEAIKQVSQGLQFLHEQHVVHLDIKSGNILLEMLDDGTAGNTWKLCDFGEALRLHKGQDEVVDTHLHDAHDSRNLTPEIASPELFNGVGVGMKTDIFAFGCVMWSILTRLDAWHWIKPGPYKGHTIEQAVGLDAKRPRCPDSLLTDMIRLCMHHNAAQRPSAQELSTWAHKHQTGLSRRRRSRDTRTRAASNASVVRVLEVPSAALLGETGEQLWTGTVPGLLSCECTSVPPLHGCEFQVALGEDTGELSIRSKHHQAEDVVTEEAVHALFDDCDTDQSGGLDRAEIRRMLGRGGIEWSTQLGQELDGEWSTLANDGEVDFESFFRWWTTTSPSDQRSHLRRELHRAGIFSNKKASVRFPCTVVSGWIVMDSSRSTGLSWNVAGQYIAKQGSASREQWEEEALQGSQLPRSISQEKEKEVQEQETLVTIRAVFGPSEDPAATKHPKSGIIFGDEWPYVKNIQPGSPAHSVPGLQAGCKLLRIESSLSAEGGDAVVEGEAVLMEFNDAVPHITAERTAERPLVLTFAAIMVRYT